MFYDNLKLVCDSKGLKITPIVAECGGAKGSITNWKNGATPNSDIVIRLAARLEVTTDFLLLGSDKCTCSEEQEELLSHFNNLSPVDKGKVIERAETLAELAAERAAKERAAEQTKKTAKPVELAADERITPDEPELCTIKYYDYPASAGTGLFLDETIGEEITIFKTPEALHATFAIPIEGDSMEPDFLDGDVVLVESCPCVSHGEIGIFLLDGEAFFKEFGGDCLISYNEEKYDPIMLKNYTSSVCLGRVLGKAEIIK